MFCKSCMAEYFEVRIKDVSGKDICCPEDNCTSEQYHVRSLFNKSPVKCLECSLFIGDVSVRSSV